MLEFRKTIAIQVSDPDFFNEYEARLKESGLKVKDYLIGLIQADIDQAQAEQMAETPPVPSPEETSALEPDTEIQKKEQAPDAAPGQEPEEAPAQGTSTEPVQDEQPDQAPPAQDAGNPSAQEITNLFVKVTKEQREALEYRKSETGETVGEYLNRVIKGFLENVRTGEFPEGLDETYEDYAANTKSCDTTCSAKIPAEMNNELTEYLANTGRSRNALMAALTDIDLCGQDMEQGQGMNM